MTKVHLIFLLKFDIRSNYSVIYSTQTCKCNTIGMSCVFTGDKPASFSTGNVIATIINKTEAPLAKTELNVLLELTGAGLGVDRYGLDLVTVLDVSQSMGKDGRLEKLIRAMRFVIKKLAPIDRLSIVTFSNKVTIHCPLRQVTEESQLDMEKIVCDLTAAGGTDIPAGVFNALKVLKSRKQSTGRTVAIMLMSDGETDGDISQLHLKDVPIFTFGFGSEQDPTVLNSIAKGSKGGTFSDVQNTDNLSLAFSQCLAGLLTVVVQDLNLTLTPLPAPPLVPTTIEKLNAGHYPKPKDNKIPGSVTVAFGDLYDKEMRKVLVQLVLPEVKTSFGMDVIKISHTYRSNGKQLPATPLIATVTRSDTATEKERDEVIIELKRLRAARTIRKARELADDENLKEARANLSDTEKELKSTVLDEPSLLIESLIQELKQLHDLMKNQAMYEKLGRPFALSAETSHALQRYAARGDMEKLRLFSTARMDAYLKQAKLFDLNPRKPLSRSDEDVKLEIDPLAGLKDHVKKMGESLKAIEKILGI